MRQCCSLFVNNIRAIRSPLLVIDVQHFWARSLCIGRDLSSLRITTSAIENPSRTVITKWLSIGLGGNFEQKTNLLLTDALLFVRNTHNWTQNNTRFRLQFEVIFKALYLALGLFSEDVTFEQHTRQPAWAAYLASMFASLTSMPA